MYLLSFNVLLDEQKLDRILQIGIAAVARSPRPQALLLPHNHQIVVVLFHLLLQAAEAETYEL